jgi:hypothetical protein
MHGRDEAFQSENPEATDHLGDTGKDGRIILQLILKDEDVDSSGSG